MAEMILTEKAELFLKEWGSNDSHIIAHTSGSTGKPKEIKLLKRDMRISARNTNRFFGISGTSLLVCPLSVDYIAGKMMIVRALEAGCPLIMEEPSNSPLKEDYGEISLLPVVPSQLGGLMDRNYQSEIKNVIVGGAPLTNTLTKKLLNDKWSNYFVTYGMTETCSHVALRNIASDIYEALPDISFRTDYRGCLNIVAPRYSFVTLQSNDIVELIDDKHFRWLGRYDNVVICGGVKFFPEEIEKKLSSIIDYPFYVVGEPDEKWGEKLVLKIEVGNIDSNSYKSFLIENMKNILQRYEIPKEIILMPEFTRTSSGKIRRI